MVRVQLCKNAPVFFVILSTLLQIHAIQVITRDLEDTQCTSHICKAIGKEITDSINETINPCDDFFQHACGGWIARHPATNFAPRINRRNLIYYKVNQELRDLLEENNAHDTGAIRKAKDFFKSCINQDAIDENGQKNLQAIVTANGGWPLLADPVNQFYTQNLLTWQQIHENITNATEFSGLFQITVEVNLLNRKNYVITLNRIETPPPVLNNIAQVIDHFTKSRNVPIAQILSDIMAMYAFMDELIEAYSDGITDDIDTQYHLTTIKKMQNIWDDAVNNHPLYQIDWLNTIRRRFESIDVVIDANETIALQPRAYLQRLGALLSKTPILTIVNYIHWYNLYHGTSSLAITKSLRDNGQPARWCQCCRHHKMVHAVSLMYVRKHFTGFEARKLRDSVSEIYHQLRETVKESIDNLTWINEETRQLFRDKINGMNIQIGYPDWYDVPGEVDEYYNELTLSSDHFENILAVNRFDSRKALRKLRIPVVAAENDWLSPSTEVDGTAYINIWNTINVPAAVLQMPIFHHELPAGLKFRLLGAIIGHEIFHGFDMRGLNRDKNGTLRPWLLGAVLERYVNRTTCIVNQFNQYPITRNPFTNETTYVDGKYTLTENMADNAGFMISFKAFQRYKRLHPNENIKISALGDYSDDKLFFYELAHYFCESWHPYLHLNPRIESGHAPSAARINLALSNIQEFSDSFACAPEENMNPSHKCIIWD